MTVDLARIADAARDMGRTAADRAEPPPQWAYDTASPLLLRRTVANAWWRGWWEDREEPPMPPAAPAAPPPPD